MPKVVICVVPGWAAGGGHSLHVVCDLTLASAEHARFKQTDADVGSFDGGFGSAYLARQVGQKFAREIFFLGDEYSAEDAHRMGTVNRVVPHAELEAVALEWGRKINGKSPTAQRMLKYSFNLIDDGLVGQQLFAGEATRLAYMTDEAVGGPRPVPREARARLVAVPLVLLISPDRGADLGGCCCARSAPSSPWSRHAQAPLRPRLHRRTRRLLVLGRWRRLGGGQPSSRKNVAGLYTPDDPDAEVTADCAGDLDAEVDATQDCHLDGR